MTSPSRYRQRRDANESEIIKALEAVGVLVWKLHTPADLLTSRHDVLRLLEVKDGAKPKSARKLTPAQQKTHPLWPITVVTSVAEALLAVGVDFR